MHLSQISLRFLVTEDNLNLVFYKDRSVEYGFLFKRYLPICRYLVSSMHEASDKIKMSNKRKSTTLYLTFKISD
jgi:hypothetical protein